MSLTNLQKRIEEAFKVYVSSCPANYVIVDEKKTFEAGFLAGIEDTATRVIQSNDNLIREIDALVSRAWTHLNVEKFTKTPIKPQQNT